MTSERPNEASIFNAARKIESADKRDAFLSEACGNDTELRGRVDKLLAAFIEESQFLEQPAPGLEKTVIPHSPENSFAASMDAGLAATFGKESAVVVGKTNHSVLKSMSASLTEVPRVSLREPKEEGEEPIQRPSSPEIPQQPSDSRYRLDGEIARGGMGAVLRGRDTDLGRDLAVKVLLDAHKDKPEVVQRFIEEAQIGGQLQHPGIAPVYELGQFADQRPFFSMKLVKGDTLAKLLLDRASPSADRSKLIGIFEQVCQTMACAHSRGVIHRDLKPANIMVGAFGEVQVMDWGLAKVLSAGGVADEKATRKKQNGETLIQTMRSVGSDIPGSVGSTGSETQAGSVMGTPAYMPPEQALGEIDMLDQRADVFGLGAILAEILTGKPPYVADDGTQIYRMASRGKLGDCFTRLDECGADDELISLAKQCLEVEPSDRPKDANALAEQVTGYLESVETKLRTAEVQRARFRITLGLGAAALAILIAGIVATAWQAREAKLQTRIAQDARNEATEERDHARKAERDAVLAKNAAEDAGAAEKAIAEKRRRELYAANLQLADQLYNGQNGEQRRIEQLLASWIPIDDKEEDLREFSWRYQWNRLHTSAKVTVPTSCKGVAFTPAGKLLVTDSTGLHEVDEDGNKRELISWTLKVDQSYFSPDGRWVAINVESGIEIYHLKSREKVLAIPQNRCSFSVNGKYLAAFKSGAKVDSLSPDEDAVPVWNLEQDGTVTSGAPLAIGATTQLPSAGACLKLGSDGKSFLLRFSPGAVERWEVGAFLDGNPEPRKWSFVSEPADFAWSPDGKIIASAGALGNIELRLTSDVTQELTIKTHGKITTTMRFSSDGKVLATGGHDGTIDLWDVSALASLASTETPNQQSGKTGERKAPSIQSAMPRLIRSIKAHLHTISTFNAAMNFSADGQLLASRDSSGNVKLWTLPETKVTRLSESIGTAKHDSESHATQFDMVRLAEDRISGEVPIPVQLRGRNQRDARIGKMSPRDILEGSVEVGEQIAAVFDPDQGDWKDVNKIDSWEEFDYLVAGPIGTTVKLKLENSQDEQHEVTLRRARPRWELGPLSVAFSPDAENVAVANVSHGVARLGLRNNVTKRYAKRGSSVAYSPDGRYMAIADATTISILNCETDEEVYLLDSRVDREVMTGNQNFGDLAFSPDGRFLAHVSGFRPVGDASDLTVWRTSDFKKIGDGPLHKMDFAMNSVIFSPDSSLLLVGDSNGQVQIRDTSQWKSRGLIQTPHKAVFALAVSPDGKRLYAGGLAGSSCVTIWDLETRTQLHRLSSKAVGFMALSPDGRTLAVGSFDHNVSLWDALTGNRLQTIQAHAGNVFGVAFSKDGRRLATVDHQGVLRLWNAETKSDISEDSDTLRALLRLGLWRFEQKRFEDAEALFSKVVELNRKSGRPIDSEVKSVALKIRQTLQKTGKWRWHLKWESKFVGARIGEQATLSVQPIEGDWTYQWYCNYEPVEGATNPTLRLSNITADQIGT